MENEPSCIYINVDPECDRCPPAHGGSFYVSSTSLTYWISMFPDCLNYYEYFLIHTALFAVLAQSVQLSKLPGLLSVFSLNVLFEGESHRETWKNKILFFFLFLFCKCYVQFLFSRRPRCDVIHWQSPVTWSLICFYVMPLHVFWGFLCSVFQKTASLLSNKLKAVRRSCLPVQHNLTWDVLFVVTTCVHN